MVCREERLQGGKRSGLDGLERLPLRAREAVGGPGQLLEVPEDGRG
ncbi:MAG TPA: hypothetical protein VFQ21_05590 [Gemmatimonadota bacterium]|nr:hypothetical protein [Gemmatimonadota bacterium]